MNDFGNTLKKIRKEKSITQKELAESTGIAEITIRQYEANKYKPKYEKLKLIAKALDIEPYELLDDKDNDIFMSYQESGEDKLQDKFFEDNLKERKIYDIYKTLIKFYSLTPIIGYGSDMSSIVIDGRQFMIYDDDLIQIENDCDMYLKFRINEFVKRRTNSPTSNED